MAELPDKSNVVVGSVRMFMSELDALDVRDSLAAAPEEDRQRLKDQLWLHVVLWQQRKRTGTDERASFDARADRILEALDP